MFLRQAAMTFPYAAILIFGTNLIPKQIATREQSD
jgi:hypothetical protein